MKTVFVYRCKICKKDEKYHIQPLEDPTCCGPEGTHKEAMKFIPEKSTDTPRYLQQHKEKKK
jgi:hypothetical protein